MNDIAMYPEPYVSKTQRGELPLDQPAENARGPQNISQIERTFSTLGGSALVAIGLSQLLAGDSRGKLAGLLIGGCGGALLYRGLTGHCHLYDALGIDTAEHNEATAVPARQGEKVEKTIAINQSAEQLYAFWSNLENLPSIMPHLSSVEVLDDRRSRWEARGPLGKSVRWEAEIIEQRAPELISWRSIDGGDIDTAGSVHFKSLGPERGTALVVSLKYNPPAGKLGAAIASLLGSGLEQELDEDLRRFKSIMEAGEAPTTDGQPSGR